MAERIPQSQTLRVPLRAYLSTDHLSAAIGKTIAITISKNGGAFGNPSGGATNATEIANGWYYVDLTTTDTGTVGPLIVYGTATGVDTIELPYDVASTTAVSAGVNVVAWNGTTVATPATAGVPDVNAKAINNVATTSVTTVNANVGTTQPTNYTGTGGTALVKADMVDIAGAAVSTASAQIGVNAVQLGGTAQTGRDIGASVLLSAGTGTGQLDFTAGVVKTNLVQILATALSETVLGNLAASFKKFFDLSSPTSTMNTITTVTTTTTATNLTNAPTNGDFTATMKTSLNAATPASVVGSVGSVAGNVAGSVGSVDGNVSGSVNSVVSTVTANLVQILGTPLTETIGGYLAAAFKKLFDVATPVFTAASVNQTGDAYGRIGLAGAGLTALGDTRIANLDATISSRLASSNIISTSGTAQSGSATNIRLAAGAPAVSLTGQTVFIVSGTGAGQSSPITAYNTSTKDATTTWTTAPDATSAYVVLAPQGGSSGGGGSDPWATVLPGSYTGNQAGALEYATYQKAQLIAPGSAMNVVSPLSGSTLTIIRGDDYLTTNNNAISVYVGTASTSAELVFIDTAILTTLTSSAIDANGYATFTIAGAVTATYNVTQSPNAYWEGKSLVSGTVKTVSTGRLIIRD